MELLTLNEIIQTIVEETKGLDPELIEDMILKEVDIPSTEIVRLKEGVKDRCIGPELHKQHPKI